MAGFEKFLTKCEECPYRGRQVGSKGSVNAPFVIVGESPGIEELKRGEPFVGPSGEMIHKIIPEEWVSSGKLFVTNALRCRPRKKSPKDLRKAIDCCNERLLAEIKAAPRKVILALGGIAAQALLGREVKITKERGTIYKSELAEEGIVLSVHPAFLLRGGGNYKTFKQDLQKAINLLGLPEEGGSGERGAHFQLGRVEVQYELVDTEEKASRAVEEIIKHELVAADIETSGFDHKNDKILCLGVAAVPDKAFIFPKGFENFDSVRRLLEVPPRHLSWIWHNGKFDIKFLREVGLAARVDEDTMLLSYCLNEIPGYHDLDQVASDWLQVPPHKNMLDEYLPNKKASFELVPKPVLYEYLSLDLSSCLRLFHRLRPEVGKDSHLDKLYTKTLIPASELLARIEMRGIMMDEEVRSIKEEELERELRNLESNINVIVSELTGGTITSLNPNSSEQVSHLLFDVLKLPSKRRSTRKEVLDKLPKLPIVKAIKDYRRVGKLLSTYIRGLRKHVHEDGRIYSTFLLHGTPTGRLASRNPNLQNIPRDSEIRNIFRAPTGYLLVADDLNQAELRSLAMCSGDDFLCSIYKSTNRSLHKEVARDMYGENYTKDQLIRAKAVNFGIVYGRTPYSLAEEFDISLGEASDMIDSWFRRSPKAAAFIKRCREAPLKGQVLVTPFGRKRRFGVVGRESLRDIQNEAANFPHQSIASDINLHAAMKAQPKLEEMGVYIVNLVHDESLKEVPDVDGAPEEVSRIMRESVDEVVQEWLNTDIPFVTESKKGTNWGSLEEF